MTIATPYGQALLALGAAEINFTADTFNLMLMTSSYTPDVDADTFLSDIQTHEVTGTNYTAGGQAMSGIAWSYGVDTAVTPNIHRAILDADDVAFINITLTAYYSVCYQATGTDTTSRLIGYIDYQGAKTFTATDFVQSFSTGVLRLRVSS